MRVATFQPLEEHHALEFLHLTNIKPDDGSLKPLAHESQETGDRQFLSDVRVRMVRAEAPVNGVSMVQTLC